MATNPHDKLQDTIEETAPQAKNLRDVRRLCKLGPLKPAELGYWVDTDAARDPSGGLRDGIKKKLAEGPQDARLLVYGHSGSGKSTELTKLTTELGDDYFIVSFSVREDLNFAHVIPEDIPVVLAEHVLSEAERQGLNIPGKRLRPIYEWFATTTKTDKDASDSALTIGAQAEVGAPLNPFLKLLASLKSDIRYSTGRETSSVLEVRKRKGELVDQVNIFLNEVRFALPPSQRLLIIVEDMDKFDIASARDVFINNANLLLGINATIIYTIPIFTFHSPDAAAIRTAFDDHIALPMIKVMDHKGNRAGGFDTVKQVVRCRVPEALLPEDALDLAAEKTGGVLRHLFEVIHTAAAMTDIASETEPLTVERIRYGLQRKRREFYQEIAIPFGGVLGQPDLKVGELYKRLSIYAKRQLAGEKNQPPTDPINQILLQCCALVEYNGEGWYGVHPIVMEMLREQGEID